jgi:hypothetical protein
VIKAVVIKNNYKNMFKEKIAPKHNHETRIKQLREIVRSQLSRVYLSQAEAAALFNQTLADMPDEEKIDQRDEEGKLINNDSTKLEMTDLEKERYINNFLTRTIKEFDSINPQSAINSLKRFPELLRLPQASELAQALEMMDRLESENK